MKKLIAPLAILAVFSFVSSCDEDSAGDGSGDGGVAGSGGSGQGTGAGNGSAGNAGGAAGTAGVTGTDGTPILPDGGIVGVASCGVSGATACYDGKDNDGDGKVDLADPECTGPCDNDEASFATGISGDNIDACKQDCFFDGNSGQGDDGCDWNLKCDPANPGGQLAKACPYDDKYKNCPDKQSEKCTNTCRRVTPNGCDCFGCCAIPSGNMTKTVILAGSCTVDKLDDPKACPPCTQQASCINTCEKCEICIGKPAPDPSCAPATPTNDAGMPLPTPDGGAPPPPAPVCEEGLISCGEGGQVPANMCTNNTYCITGCCILPIN